MWTTDKQESFRAKIREFAEGEIGPYAAQMDEEQHYPEHLIGRMNELGLLGMAVPPKYGGTYTDTMTYIIAVEEVSRICGSSGIILAAHNSLGCWPIYAFGTEEQKNRYLPEITTGGKLAAFGLSEPGAGSDAGGTKTFAEKIDRGFKVNGSKCWITNGGMASTIVFTARTSHTKDTHAISSFVVKAGTKGFEVGKKENKLGVRGSDTRVLHFDDCLIPDSDLLGEVGSGFKQFMMTLDGGRISIGALALGLAQGAYDVALKYAKHHEQFGEPISDFQAVAFKLADMATQLQAARHLIYHAAALKDEGKRRFTTEAAMAKLYASEVGNFVTYQAMMILGADGYSTKYPVERLHRDLKICEIGEGTSEIQRLVISRNILKDVI
jgi:butyryl-CoA dehydrogenase